MFECVLPATGPHPLRWRLWDDSYDMHADAQVHFMDIKAQIADDGYLAFGEMLPAQEGKQADSAGEFRLSGVRVRRLTTGRDPKGAPRAEWLAYWEKRLAHDPGDVRAALQLAEESLNDERTAEALDRADAIVAMGKPLYGAPSVRGRALFGLGRYEEALQALELADQEPGDDALVLGVMAIIRAAGPESVRDIEKATGLAERAMAINKNNHPLPEATLAVCFAAKGDFARAKELNQAAIGKAWSVFKERLAERQSLYEANQPYVMGDKP